MRQRLIGTMIVLCLAALTAGAIFAQAPQKVSVPFKFQVNNVTYEAGTYYVTQKADGTRLELRDARQKTLVQVPVLSRLSAKSQGGRSANTRLVFDEAGGDERHLSEVWISGRDGYLVRAASEKHRHSSVSDAATGTP